MKWLWIVVVIYILIFGTTTSLRHYNFQTQAWDLGIFTQTIWNTAHGRFMENTLEFVGNHFAVHMSPILLVFAPFYAIFPSPYFLLWLQTIVLALGAWPIYLLARSHLASTLALIVSIIYLLYPALHWVNWFDFHPIAFFIPAMLAAFYFHEVKKWWWMSLFLILAASTQEDAILAVTFFGIYVICKKLEIIWKLETGNWKFIKQELIIGLLLLLISIFYFFLATKLIMPSYGGGLLRIDRYSHLGAGFGEIFKNLFLHPSLFINTLFQWQKVMYLFWLFLPVTFLPLLAPWEWILLIPGLAQNLLTNYAPQFSGIFQYDSVLIPGIFIATIYGLKKTIGVFAFLAPPSERGSGWRSGAPPDKSGDHARATRQTRKNTNRFLALTVIFVPLFSFLLHSPVSPFNFPKELLHKNERTVTFYKIIEALPKNASVAAHTNIVPHIANREKVYMLGYEPELEPDILLIDGSDYFGFPNPETFERHIQKYADSGKYDAEIIDERYYVIKRK